MTGLHEGEVDGVRTWWADLPGPVRAGLVFRAGQADATLATNGTAHLAEHLAVASLGRDGQHAQGSVEPLVLELEVEADDPAGATGLLARLAAACAAPDPERVAVERRVLAAEAARGGRSAAAALLAARFGAQGPGLAGFDELGLRDADVARVGAWARRHLTAGAATAWMTCPPPPGLRLALPPGPGVPAPATPPLAVGPLPAELRVPGSDGVTLAALVPDGDATGLLALLLADLVPERLRTQIGVSYAPDVDVALVAPGRVHLTLGGDARPADAPAAVRELLALLDGLAAQGPEEAVRERALAATREALLGRDRERSAVRRAAHRAVRGRPPVTPEELVARLGAIRADELREVAGQARATALVLLDDGAGPTGLPPLGDPPAPVVEGRRLRRRRVPRRLDAPAAVVVGPDGVRASAGGREVAVRLADVAAAVREPGGMLVLVGRDGTALHLDPGDLRGGREAVERVLAALPAGVLVGLEERAARVEDALRRTGASAWWAGEGLELLAEHLGHDEELHAVVDAMVGMRGGALAVTDRRLVHTGRLLDEHVLSWPLADVRRTRLRAHPAWAVLVVELAAGRVTFSFVSAGRARTAARALDAALSAA